MTTSKFNRTEADNAMQDAAREQAYINKKNDSAEANAQLNTLETAMKLLTEVGAESKRTATTTELTRLTNISLVSEYGELLKDYDQIHKDCEKAELSVTDSAVITSRLMSTSNAVESLTDDLCNANDTIIKLENDQLSMAAMQRKVAAQAVEIKSLSAYKKKSEVLSRDLKAMESNYQKARAVQVKPVKTVKASHSQLQKKNDQLNKYISELVKYGESAPQFAGGLKHSTQGVMDFIDAKPERMSVKESADGPEIEKLVQRVFVINMHNSVKVMTRIIGEPGLHTCKIGKGCTVQIDDEVRDHVTEYFKTLDEMNAKLKQQKGHK